MSLYGNKVNISKFRMEGQSPDGTARPGADMEFMVSYDPTGAGCGVDAEGFCDPGADITWYLNGTEADEKPWTGYNQGLGGYIATFRAIAPQTGTMTVTARSTNDATWVVTVSATSITAGQVAITSLACANQEDWAGAGLPGCACEGDGSVTIWYTSQPTSAGDGEALFDVLVNGSVVLSNQTASTAGRGRDVVRIPCPPTGSTISIKGKQDSGASLVYQPSTTQPVVPDQPYDPNPQCNQSCTGDWCDDSGNMWYCTGGCSVRSGYTCTPGSTPDTTPTIDTGNTTVTDPIQAIKDFYDTHQLLSIVSVALLGGLIIFGGGHKSE
jgi:hypothetical protein